MVRRYAWVILVGLAAGSFGSQDAPAFGVLYPDMDKITNVGAFYVNGPPGYPFKPVISSGGTK